MKHIEKQPELESFKQWKDKANENWQPTWKSLQKPEKPDLHKALLKEQGHICCYCGQRIRLETSHIEHFKPRRHFPMLALDYGNLLASCPGYPDEENQAADSKGITQEYCGAKKDDWYDEDLLISPLQADCADYFRYAGDGQILPSKDQSKNKAAAETIQRLGLDHSKLERARKKAIDGILDGVEQLTPEEIGMFLDGLFQKNSQGELAPFVSAIAYILQSFLIAQ